MSDTIILLHAGDLPGIAGEAHQFELGRTLEDLETNNGKNYGIYDDPTFTPEGAIAILPFPSVGPAGSTKICDGRLLIDGNIQKVSAYRLP
jgi:hypothetical protein